jgi:hypothetical protein
MNPNGCEVDLAFLKLDGIAPEFVALTAFWATSAAKEAVVFSHVFFQHPSALIGKNALALVAPCNTDQR